MAPSFRLGFVSLHVRDLAAARAFYEGVLGARFLLDLPKQHEAFVDLGGTPLSLHVDADGACGGRTPGGASGFYLQVEDLDAWRAHLSARGVACHADAANLVSFHDPSGNELVLWQPRVAWPPE